MVAVGEDVGVEVAVAVGNSCELTGTTAHNNINMSKKARVKRISTFVFWRQNNEVP